MQQKLFKENIGKTNLMKIGRISAKSSYNHLTFFSLLKTQTYRS